MSLIAHLENEESQGDDWVLISSDSEEDSGVLVSEPDLLQSVSDSEERAFPWPSSFETIIPSSRIVLPGRNSTELPAFFARSFQLSERNKRLSMACKRIQMSSPSIINMGINGNASTPAALHDGDSESHLRFPDTKEVQLREAMFGKRGTMKLKKRGERHVKKNKIRRDQRRHQPQQKSLRGKAAMPKTRARGKRTQKKRSFRPRMSYSKY